MPSKFSSENFPLSSLCKYIFILGLLIYLIFISIPNQFSNYSPVPSFFSSFKKTPSSQTISSFSSITKNHSQTSLNHLVFGLLGSEKAWHYRKSYIQSWWRPKQCRGFIYLDKAPTKELLPWSKLSPSYKISEDLTKFLKETNARAPVMIRMVHSIMEVFRQVEHEEFRWLVMGDDDSIFFIENMVDVLREYDHTKYYYLGGQSEFIMSNYWYSFNQGFGGAGFILSYPLAKALAQDMENCLRRHAQLSSADHITMVCIADLGVNLSPQKGIHQIDLRGDISGFLSSHPKAPLLSLHHLDGVDPIFPSMDSFKSTRHLMKAAKADQSRLMQQTICHHRQNNWTFSVSWGYSAHLYQKILPRSFLQNPIETFRVWSGESRDPPNYMFNTRLPSDDPSENPSVFFFKDVKKTKNGILTTYSRALPQNHSSIADDISEIQVLSPTEKRIQMDRCECCDIISVDGKRANLKFRECLLNEVIA